MNRVCTGGSIARRIYDDVNLNWAEKMLYFEISEICKSQEFCNYENKVFSRLLEMDADLISISLNSLVKKNYIDVSVENVNNRIIKIK